MYKFRKSRRGTERAMNIIRRYRKEIERKIGL
jgi:hypothetical protein